MKNIEIKSDIYTITQKISKYEIYYSLKFIKFVSIVYTIVYICDSCACHSSPVLISSWFVLILLSGNAFLRNFSSTVVRIVASGISEMEGTERVYWKGSHTMISSFLVTDAIVLFTCVTVCLKKLTIYEKKKY